MKVLEMSTDAVNATKAIINQVLLKNVLNPGVTYPCNQCDLEAKSKQVLKYTCCQSMKVSSIHVPNVNFKHQVKAACMSMLRKYMVWLNMPFHMMTFCPIYP